ncbi:ROK family protein [Actinopolymorpha alba]|uniref:ROK family protein n=1 Tax=Actinopolymorpha alba TaxID=533267 RepID=UPI000375A7BC|nr:ROK family protein [Actinopolymorpha alba]
MSEAGAAAGPPVERAATGPAATGPAAAETVAAKPRATVVALDVGGTSMKGAVVDAGHTVRARRSFPTPVADGPDAVIDQIGTAFEALTSEAVGLGLAAPSAAGLVVPGIVDEERGVAVVAANVGWRDAPLASVLGARLGIPVALGHDVRAGGLAENVLGAGVGAENALFIALGTGIAASCIVDGRPIAAGGYAGEVGHVSVDPEGEPCPCGGRGCLERVASAAGVARRYTVRSGIEVAGSAEVATRVRAGDPIARAVWDEALAALVTVLHTTVTLLGPEVVVVGGGLAEAEDLMVGPLEVQLDKRLTFQRRPRVVRAALGDQAGCLGAALLAWRASGQRVAP